MALAGCGGVKNSGTTPTTPVPSGPTTGGAAPTVNGGAVNSPIVVSLSGGGNAAGVDIQVPGAAAATPPNAEDLGVAPLGGGGSAANTGGTIQRGSTMRVLLFGAGLTGDMTVTIGGPNDIAVTNVHAITSTTGTPGVSFDAVVSPTAALGARSVFLKNPQSDITAFAGGLEVTP